MALGHVALVVFAVCRGCMSRYANTDLRLDRGAIICSDNGVVRGWVWGSTASSLHSYGGLIIEQEVERCEVEHYRCRHFFTDSRFDVDGGMITVLF